LSISGDVSIALTDGKNQDVPFTINDNQDGTFTIAFTAKSPGIHCISVLFSDNEIPISPFKINVEPSIDINKIRIEGLETSEYQTFDNRAIHLDIKISLSS
jgi:filamin